MTSTVEVRDSGLDWVPEIPKSWEVKRLKDIFSFGKGLPITKADLVDKGIAVISYGQIHSKSNSGTHLAQHLLRFVPSTYLETNPLSLLKQGDIILADTSEDLDGLGNAALMDVDDTVFAGYHTIILRPNDASISKYLSYLFKTDSWRSQLRASASGIKVFSATQKMLRSCDVILPPKSDRDAITAYLDIRCAKIDEIVTEAKASIEDLRAYELSVISGTTITQEWSVLNLRHCIQNIEQGWSSPPAEAVDEENGWFVLTLSAVKRGAFYAQARKPIDANAKIPENLELHKNDFLMTRSNTRELVGDVCVVDADAEHTIFSDLIYRITFNEKLLPQYAKYLLRSSFVRQQIQSAAQGTSSSMPKISHKVIKGLKVPVPSHDEQTKIVKYLDSVSLQINALITEKEALIADLEAYKKSLIYEAVTGKRKVV